jgi:hypothetical protein
MKADHQSGEQWANEAALREVETTTATHTVELNVGVEMGDMIDLDRASSSDLSWESTTY